MNTNKQILLDNTIVKWFAWVLNLLVMMAGKIAPKNHDLSIDFQTIAICKFKGLGSILQSTPLLQTLKKAYPEARIIFITSSSNQTLLSHIDLIDEVVTLQDKTFRDLLKNIIPFIWKVFRLRAGVYIDLEVYSNFSSVIAALSNAQNRFGYYLKESHYRMGIYTHMMYYNAAVPISQTYLQWARLLGCREIVTELFRFETVLNQPAEDRELQDRRYILINPNASDLRIERRWPRELFVVLIDALYKQHPELDILLIGSPGERAYVQTIAERFDQERVRNMAGRTSISGLIRLIDKAALVITNDTGPMHLAFALQKPTVALFGPCSPAQYGDHPNAVIIYKNVYCSPCVHEFRVPPCGGNNQCMKQIRASEVLAVAEQILETGVPGTGATTDRRVYSIPGEGVLGIIRRTSY